MEHKDIKAMMDYYGSGRLDTKELAIFLIAHLSEEGKEECFNLMCSSLVEEATSEAQHECH